MSERIATSAAPARMASSSLARRAAQAAIAPRPPSPAAAAKLRICLLDVIGAALESGDLPWGRQAIGLAAPIAGGAPIIGAHRSTPGDAAFANAVLAHGLVREDMHAGAISHLGVVVIPTLLALAATRRVTGAAFIAAGIAGYEIGARIGAALITTELARLFRPTGITGPLAAAAAGSALLGLDLDRATNAIALAANVTGGLNEWPATGGTEMFFHPGFAARNALAATELAAAGAEASDSALDGPAGLFAGLRRDTALPEIGFFEAEPEILAVYNKPVPACNFAQTACQVALRLVHDQAVQPEDIRAIRIRVTRAAARYPGCAATGPFDRLLQAKMSIPFGVAATLLQGHIAESNYALPPGPALERLLSVTRLEEDAALTARFPAQQGASIELDLGDRQVSAALADVVAATPQQVRERFLQAATARLGPERAAAINAFVGGLAEATDMAPLGHLLVAGDAR